MLDCIDCGHNAYPDIGATGILQEDDCTKAIGLKLVDFINSNNGQAICVTPFGKMFDTVTESLAYRCNLANSKNATRYISIHLNKAANEKANGVEIYVTSTAGEEVAIPILRELLKLGYKNRGVKYTDSLYVLNHTNAPAVLIECGFLSNEYDMKLYNPEKIAAAIATGLGYTTKIEDKGEEKHMDKIVTYLGDADVFAAIIVSQHFKCPLMRKADFEASGLKADKVIQIGGKPGSTRESTFKDAANML